MHWHFGRRLERHLRAELRRAEVSHCDNVRNELTNFTVASGVLLIVRDQESFGLTAKSRYRCHIAARRRVATLSEGLSPFAKGYDVVDELVNEQLRKRIDLRNVLLHPNEKKPWLLKRWRCCHFLQNIIDAMNRVQQRGKAVIRLRHMRSPVRYYDLQSF